MQERLTGVLPSPMQEIRFGDFEAAMQKLRGVPPAKWLLMDPDGRVWAQADPLELVSIIQEAARRP